MTRAVVLLAVAAALVGPVAPPAGAREEPPAAVAPLLRGLRRGIVPRARDGTPRRLFVIVSALTPERRAALEAAGLRIELPAPGGPAIPWHDGEVVQGLAAPDRDAALRALPYVRRHETPGAPWPAVGSVTTAGDGVHRGPAARAAAPGAGSGVAVGVISDGVERMGASVDSGDLPAGVELVPAGGPAAGAGREGTAMLEIVHDLAPGARLLFAAPRTSAEMVVAIEALAGAGAAVIVDDLVFTDEPKFSDGPVALAARRFARGGGVYVTAAGNFARTHWIGDYRSGGPAAIGGGEYAGIHLFAAKDAGNGVRVPGGGEVLAVLQWNEPFGGAGRDFDLVLVREGSGGDAVLAASTEVQGGSGNPYEALRWLNDGGAPADVYLAVAEFQGGGARTRLNLVVFSRSAVALEHVVPGESVFGHAAVEEVLSAAAAPAGAPQAIEAFSSQGPATVFFPQRETRLVPRIAAVNGVETAVGRSGFFANPFFGTSAAAPHVAGCAAIVRGVAPDGAGTGAALLATALDVGAEGTDELAGAGLLDCAAAVRLASGTGTPPEIAGLAASFSPTGEVLVSGAGRDVDADVRRVTVRLFDAVGRELERREERVTAPVADFQVALGFRGPALAEARGASVEATDASGLAGGPGRATFACPGDASLGDAFCRLGDLTGRLRAIPGRRGTRIARRAVAAARRLADAGAAPSTPRARRSLGRAEARLRALARRLAGPRGDAALAAEATALRDAVRLLRETFIAV
jgi:hypothetical protein